MVASLRGLAGAERTTSSEAWEPTHLPLSATNFSPITTAIFYELVLPIRSGESLQNGRGHVTGRAKPIGKRNKRRQSERLGGRCVFDRNFLMPTTHERQLSRIDSLIKME